MSLPILTGVLVIMAGCATLAYALVAEPAAVRRRARANLVRHRVAATGPGAAGGELGTETGEGAASPAAFARRLAPAGTVRRLERLLQRAGRPAGWTLEKALLAKPVLALVAATFTLLFLSIAPSRGAVLIGIVATGISFFLPEILLDSRGKERSQQIQLELADTLDQMMIAVEAGLGFDSAMARVGRNGDGPLAQELIRTLQDIQVGQSRRQAYDALAARTDVPDLRRFVRAVIQADLFGISVTDVLRTQASEMRLKRRQRAEEKAMQIPVKVIFPLMVCVLPVLFIVLMAPAAMDIMAAFS